ncbi:MAG: ATP-grasp domain-containing protein [Frankia sp.]
MHRVVMIGFGRMLLTQLDSFLPPKSVVVLEDPDVARRRDVESVTDLACLAEVRLARYHQQLECVDVAVEALGDEPVQAVLPGVEYAVVGAAALADRWGLPGASPAAAALLTDKLRLRGAAQAGGLRNPEWIQVHSVGDVRDFAAGGPVVLKPANRHASLGVQLLGPDDDLAAAWETTVGARDAMMLPDHDLDWRYLAERIVVGHEYSVEALVQKGTVRFANVTDKLTAGGRYPVELGHVVPAALPLARQESLREATARLVDAVGFGDGILHAEWMVDDEPEPVLIECAARIPGDSIVDLIDLSYGFRLVRAMTSILSGLEPELPDRAHRASTIRFLSAPAGRVTAVTGLEEARAVRGVVGVTTSVALGDSVGALRSSWDRVGHVIATGPDPQAAAERATTAAERVAVVTAPDNGAA